MSGATEDFVAVRRLFATDAPAVRDALATLFDADRPVARPAADDALGPAAVRALTSLRLLGSDGRRLRPFVHIGRDGRSVIASDRLERRLERDFVLGVGPAGRLMARLARRHRVDRALDLGTGSGIVALAMAEGGATVDAVDISPRALAFLRFNAAVNGCRAIRGIDADFLGVCPAPETPTIERHAYDLVIANPPFVVSPSHELTYRDRPLPGDEVGARTVAAIARALAPGGRGYLLAEWIVRPGAPDPDAPVRAWVAGTALAATIRPFADRTPEAYAAAWVRDRPASERADAAATWSAALHAEGVARIRTGVIALATMGP